MLAWGEDSGKLSWRPVTQTFVRKADAIYKLTYADGTVVETTWSHPFYIEGRGWVKAKDLAAGDLSYTAPYVRMMARAKEPAMRLASFASSDPATGSVSADDPMAGPAGAANGLVALEVIPQRSGAVTVYNFSVEDAHNYFVSNGELLVHNSTYLTEPTGFNIAKRAVFGLGVSRADLIEAYGSGEAADRFELGRKYGKYMSPEELAVYDRVVAGKATPEEAEAFKAKYQGMADKLGLTGNAREAYFAGIFDQAIMERRIAGTNAVMERGTQFLLMLGALAPTALPRIAPSAGPTTWLSKVWNGLKEAVGLGPKGTAAAPGQFVRVAESMSPRAAAYQSRITGVSADTSYVVNGVKFDGYTKGILVDAKGPGYATFVRDGQFQTWWKGADGLVSQAQRQLQVSGGTPIQWHFAEEAAANATRRLLQSRGVRGIEIIVTP